MENTYNASTSTSNDPEISLDNLKGFASYLLGSFIEKASKEYYELLTKTNSPLVNLFEQKDKDDVENFFNDDFEKFVESILDQSIIEKELLLVEKRNIINLSTIPGFKIKVFDYNLRYSIIKKVFFNFLPGYSTNVEKVVNVLRELEEIQLYIEQKVSNLQYDSNYQTLRKERDFAESLINNCTDGIIAFNKNFIITAWNKVVEKLSGIREDFVIGKSFNQLFPEYFDTEEGQAVQRTLQGEKVFLPERAFADGKGFYDANAVPVFGYENEVIGGFILLHDITQKKLDAQKLEESKTKLQKANQELVQQISELTHAQEEIKNNEKLLRRTQKLAHIGTWVWNVGDNRIQWSGELSEIFGVNKNQEIASVKNYLERVPLEERKALYRQIREALKSQRPFDYEHSIDWPDGTTKFIYGNGIPEIINKKLIITGFCQDVTPKRKVIETLQSSENRFRTLCEKSPDAIFLMEKERIIYCNQAAVHLLKASSKSQILNLSPAYLFPEFQPDSTNSVKRFNRLMNLAFVNEGKRFEWVHKKLSGENFWTEVILTPIQLEERNVLHVVWRDITIRKKTEGAIKKAKAELLRINNQLEGRVEERTRDLAKTNKNLMKVNADLDNFIYTASHDLKAPISNIEGLLNEMIQNECYKDKEVKWLIDMMMVSVDKFKRTIQDLTEVTQVQKMEAEDIHPINVPELLEDIKFSIQNMISSNKAIIESDFSACDCIVFSRRNLRSLMFNLTSNALKYRSPDRPPHIFISTQVLDEYIVLSIRDNGLGLKDSDKEKVFSMFKRVHAHVEGSGVGLYIVKRIMENEGGKVILESKEGVGSVFKLYFRLNGRMVELEDDRAKE